jgi:hypothetical protein
MVKYQGTESALRRIENHIEWNHQVHTENLVDVHMSGDDKLNVPLSQLTAI